MTRSNRRSPAISVTFSSRTEADGEILPSPDGRLQEGRKKAIFRGDKNLAAPEEGESLGIDERGLRYPRGKGAGRWTHGNNRLAPDGADRRSFPVPLSASDSRGPAIKVRVTVDSASVKATPAIGGQTLATVPLDSVLDAEGKKGQWYKVLSPGTASRSPGTSMNSWSRRSRRTRPSRR